eukprot:95378_1
MSLDTWIRNHWTVGSKVEVHSSSSNCWIIGDIVRIFNDTEGEWLEVQYSINSIKRLKQIPHNDEQAIRPLSKAMKIYEYIYKASKPLIIKQNNKSIFCKSPVYGKKHIDTQSFDHMKILKYSNNSRIHLSKLIWWQSMPWSGTVVGNGIQCEWDIYDNDGKKFYSVKSDADYGTNNNPMTIEMEIPFGCVFYGQGSINCGDLLDGWALKSNLKMEMDDIIEFGGSGGMRNKLDIPKGHIVIGFHGGFGGHLHNLGIITMPYKRCVDYVLIQNFFEKYCGFLSASMRELILEYVFVTE